MTQYLFLFSIGPVQAFISQARKTGDLYAGSQMLSCLIDDAMETLEKASPEAERIYPRPEIESKPNRFIAIINTDTPEPIGAAVEAAVRDRFRNMADEVFERFTSEISKPDGYDKQIDRFLQVNWLMYPCQSDDYAGCYEALERHFGAIKNVRAFEQFEETGRKCALDGERNVKIYRQTRDETEKAKDVRKTKLFTHDVILIDDHSEDAGIRLKDLQPGEGLSAVGFTKRCFESGAFPSTAKIALMKTLDELERDDIGKESLKLYRNLYQSVHFDAQLYYPENLTRDYFKKHGLDRLSKNLPSILKVYKNVEKNAEERKLQFQKYYAIILFDGDSMGKWLSGERLTETSNLLSFHKALSEKLGVFAQWAKSYLTPPKGQAVYAGGDDFLGLVNLDFLFEVMAKLRLEFNEMVSKPLFESSDFAIRDGKPLTFSAGIAVAHYKTPLSEVLKWARRMEKEAKEIDDNKDAFAISVIKHSGDIYKTAFKWYYNEIRTTDIFDTLVQQIKTGHFSGKSLMNLDTEFRRMTDVDGKLTDRKMVVAEMKRLVIRSCQMKRDQGESRDDFKARKDDAVKTMTENLKTLNSISRRSFENFLSALGIIDFLTRKVT